MAWVEDWILTDRLVYVFPVFHGFHVFPVFPVFSSQQPSIESSTSWAFTDWSKRHLLCSSSYRDNPNIKSLMKSSPPSQHASMRDNLPPWSGFPGEKSPAECLAIVPRRVGPRSPHDLALKYSPSASPATESQALVLLDKVSLTKETRQGRIGSGCLRLTALVLATQPYRVPIRWFSKLWLE